MEAVSADEVARDLSTRGYTAVSIQERGGLTNFSKFLDASGLFLMFNRIKSRELGIFFRQLSVLFSAGVPLFDALVALEEQFVEERIKKVIVEIKNNVEGGSTFSGALARHPAVFSNLIVAMVEAGEHAGVMEDVLKRISTYLEDENKMQQKVKAALRYPILVLSVLTIAFVFAVVFIIPKFRTVFAAFKTTLPLPTRILLGINYMATNYWWLILILLAAGYGLFNVYRRSPGGHLQWDQFLLRLPVFGTLRTKISLARFFTMLSSMITSGISIVEGLEITANTADNMVISQAISRIREKVIGGVALSACMREYKFFPPSSVHMVAIGEKSGSLDAMLMKSADYFNEETEYMIDDLMTLLEPFLIFIMGLFVTLLALGIFLPMWNVMQLYTH